MDLECKEQIHKLLTEFDIDDPEDIGMALKLGGDINQWSKFIEENVNPKKHIQFKEKLAEILVNIPSFDEPSIHEQLVLILNRIEPIDIHIQKLEAVKLDQTKWSDAFITQIQNRWEVQIKEIFQTTNQLQQFLFHTIKKVYDLLARKVDLVSFFKIIQILSRKHFTKASKLLNKIHFNDFVILFIHFTNNKEIIGKLLTEIGIPTPLFYTLNKQFFYQSDLFKSVLLVSPHHLILNIGTPGAQKCGKTKLLSSMFSLNKKNHQQSHFSDVLNFYTQFAFGFKQNVLLTDFNGSINNENLHETVREKLLMIGKKASIIILHAKETQILKQKILEQSFYKQLCSQSQKVVLIIRDSENATEKKISKILPEDLKNKTYIYVIDNLTGNEQMITKSSNQITQDLLSKDINLLKSQKEFSFSAISTDQFKQSFEKYQKLVDNIMSELNDKNYNKESILPLVTIEDKIYRKYQQVKGCQTKQNEEHQKYLEKRSVIQAEHKQLLDKKDNLVLSEFCKKGIQILKQKSKDCNEILIQSITEWKNSKLYPLKQQYISLTKQIHNRNNENLQKSKINIQKVLEEMKQYEISIDSIVSEVIASKEKSQNLQLKELISQYYKESYKNMSPINIVDGKTLQFGNEQLQSFIHNLSRQYEKNKKQIYVISVIGAQSSAKSTLLNILFRCSFQTSAGRCTKGIYFTVCQLEDLVIVVLDTEGLLSVSARDTAFDNQIATFVLKVSNLIIINNKGQLTSTLKQLLKVCMYVLQCLHKDQKEQYSPQKIIFTLRDQNKPSGNFQEEMVAQIKNELQNAKQSDSIDYTNFFSIETEDIFSLPNAFEEIRGIIGKCGSYNTYYPVFGQCILALRNRIIKLLKQSPSKTNLASFYSDARNCWKTIQQCGKDIMNYKTINQIVVKQRLSRILQQNLERYHSKMHKQYQQFFEIIKNYNSTQLDAQEVRVLLNNIFHKNKEELMQDYSSLAKRQCSSENLIKDMHCKIFDICSSYSMNYNQQLTKKIKTKTNQQKSDQFQSQLNNMVQKILKESSSTNQQIQDQFQKQKEALQKAFYSRQQQFKQKKNKFQLKIKYFISSLMDTSKQKTNLKISSLQDCIKNYQVLKQYINKSQFKKFVQSFFILSFTEKLLGLKSQQYQQIYGFTQPYFHSLQSRIQRQIYEKQIEKITQIQDNFKIWLYQMEQTLRQIQKKITFFNDKFLFISIKINPTMSRSALYGLIYQTVKQKVFKNNLKILFDEKCNANNLIQRKYKQFKKALQCRGQLGKTIEFWIQKLIDEFLKEINKFCINKAMQNLLEIKNTLSCESILASAIKKSFFASESNNKWRECFKIIKDINKYLFEIMCQSNEIATRKSIISEKINQAKKQSSKKLTEIINQLSKVKLENVSEVQRYLKQKTLIYVENQSFTKQKILKFYLKKLEQQQNSILTRINEKIDTNTLSLSVQNFIENELKDKIIGCSHTCPLCGMKCKKQKFHSDNQHQVMKNCHVLTAFAGVDIKQLRTPSYLGCFTQKLYKTELYYKDQKFQNTKEHIKINWPEWNNHFPQTNQGHLLQGDSQLNNFIKIWVHIQGLVIKYIYPYMEKDGKYDNLKRQDALTEANLDQPYQNYKGEMVTIRSEYLANKK